MKKPALLYLLLIVVVVIAPGVSGQSPAPGGNTEKLRYSIVKSSELYLQGTTNVNTFKCDCEDRFSAQETEVEHKGAVVKFRNTRLSMTTRKFNCKNAKMDRDMHKALKAEQFPKMTIDLLETRQNPDHLKGSGWFDVDAKVLITITGVPKQKQIKAQARKLSPNQYALKGSETVLMTEFGIEPPEAMFGLIKVHDPITFHFNLTIQLENHTTAPAPINQ